jgi:hypothetical protein
MIESSLLEQMLLTNSLLREMLATQRGIDEKLCKIAINTSSR